jgi:hypothetical protein
VRGDLDLDILPEGAVRYHRIYGVYGISVFAVAPPSMNPPSGRHWSIRSPESGDGQDVLAVGMRLEPTDGNPPARVVGATASCRSIIRKSPSGYLYMG